MEELHANESEDPFVAALRPDYIDKACAHCGVNVFDQPNLKISNCSACKKMRYCNSKCQKSDWPMHKFECAVFTCCEEDVIKRFLLSPNTRLVIRFIARTSYDNLSGDVKDRLNTMISHEHELLLNKIFADECTTIDVQLLPVVRKLSKYGEIFQNFESRTLEVLGVCHSLVSGILSRMQSNAFEFTTSFLDSVQSIGFGLYLRLSKIDHSCSPTVLAVFNGARACLKRFNPNDSRPVRISYIETIENRARRRQYLQEKYSFLCECELCSQGDEEPLEIKKRLLIDANRFMPSEELANRVLDIKHSENVLRNLPEKPAGIKRVYKELMRCKKELGQHNLILVKLRLLLMNMITASFDNSDEQLTMLFSAVEPLTNDFDVYFPVNHPERICQYALFAKWLKYSGELPRAFNFFEKALPGVVYLYGENHQLVKMILTQMQECKIDMNRQC